ncbi:MAG: hypothetical protein ACI9A7_001798, partial [Cyclobacteriaceae bacterium]
HCGCPDTPKHFYSWLFLLNRKAGKQDHPIQRQIEYQQRHGCSYLPTTFDHAFLRMQKATE